MTNFQKVVSVFLSLCFLAVLAVAPEPGFLWENVYRQLSLYCFVEMEAERIPQAEDPWTSDLIIERNAEYLAAKEAGESKHLPENPEKAEGSLPENPGKAEESLPENPEKAGESLPENPEKAEESLPENPEKAGESLPENPEKKEGGLPENSDEIKENSEKDAEKTEERQKQEEKKKISEDESLKNTGKIKEGSAENKEEPAEGEKDPTNDETKGKTVEPDEEKPSAGSDGEKLSAESEEESPVESEEEKLSAGSDEENSSAEPDEEKSSVEPNEEESPAEPEEEKLSAEQKEKAESKKKGGAVQTPEPVQAHPEIDLSPEKLADYEYLMNQFYIVDPGTSADPELFDGERFLAQDMTLKQDASAVQILIYHSHSQEAFSDSREGRTEDTIVGVGDYLTELLTENYGYQVLHVREAFDMIDGQLDRSRAYDYAREYVEKILEENPSIEVVIDLHRDGVPDDRRLVTEINGKSAAQVMFFNGLSCTNHNGPVDYLPNPYIQDNLAFSFQLEYQAALYYPDFYRGIYLAGLRYNLHLRPKALLLEAGAQTNTVQEVKNAMEPFADILHKVLSPQRKG